jgi:hypothetical protein
MDKVEKLRIGNKNANETIKILKQELKDLIKYVEFYGMAYKNPAEVKVVKARLKKLGVK